MRTASKPRTILLGDLLTESLYGLSVRGDRSQAPNAIPILRMNCQESGETAFRDLQFVVVDETTRMKYGLRDGDILFNRTNSIDLVGRTSIVRGDHEAVFASYLIRLRVDRSRISPGFLNYFMQLASTQQALKALATRGVSQANISASKLRGFPVPIPSLEEQEEIVRVVSAVQRRHEKSRDRLSLFATLRLATLESVFRDHRCPMVRIDKHFKVGNGATPNRSTPSFWNGDIPWITSSKVHEGYIRTASELVTTEARQQCHLPLVQRGSVVMAITGQGKTLGNAALLELDTCVNQHLAYFTPTSDEVLPEFLCAYLQTQYGNLRSAASGGGSTKGALTCSFLSAFEIPLAAVDDQRRIAALARILHRSLQVERLRKELRSELFGESLGALLADDSIGLARLREGADGLQTMDAHGR